MGRPVGGGLVLIAAVVLSACGSGGSKPKTAPRVSTTTTISTLSSAAILRMVSWQPGDVRSGYQGKLYEQGDLAIGQVTLDLCGADFPSEASRTARHQVGIVDSKGALTDVSIESVLYDSAASAVQAMRELRSAKAACPSSYVRSDVGGQPPLRYRFDPLPDGDWPVQQGIDRFAVSGTVSDNQGHSGHELDVYQQRGRVLVILYTGDTAGTTRVLTRSVQQFAQTIAARISALPSSIVGTA